MRRILVAGTLHLWCTTASNDQGGSSTRNANERIGFDEKENDTCQTHSSRHDGRDATHENAEDLAEAIGPAGRRPDPAPGV